MSVSDGSNVNAAVTNAAFISRTTDSDTVGKVGLKNTDAVSGSNITNAQRLINEIADVQGNTGEGDATSKTYATNNAITDGQNRKEAIEAIDTEFDSTSGHDHDGVNSKKIDVSNIANLNTLEALYQVQESFSATGTSDDISTEFTAKTPGGDASTEGVITTPPNNRAQLTDTSTGQELMDGTGKRVFGRITEAAGVWTLTYFVLDAGVETSASISGPLNINIFYREVFGPTSQRPTIPADVGSFDSLNATADILDASATQSGKVNTVAQDFAGVKNFTSRPTINSNDVVDINQAQVITSKDIDGGTASNTSRITLPKNTTANLNALTRKQGTVFFDTDSLNFFGDDGTSVIPLGGGSGGGAGSLDTYYTETFEDYKDTAELTAAFTLTGSGTLELDQATQLNDIKGLKFTQAAGSLADNILSPSIALSEKQKNRESKIRFAYSYDGADNDIELNILGLNLQIKSGTNIIEARFFITNQVSINYSFDVIVESIGSILRVDDIEISTSSVLEKQITTVESALYNTEAGLGSTNTKIPYFTNQVINSLSDVGVIDNSPTLGFSFTATQRCSVSMSFYQTAASTSFLGISKNSTQLSTRIDLISGTDRVSMGNTTGNPTVVTFNGVLQPGDVVRPHIDNPTTNAARCGLSITAEAYSSGIQTVTDLPVNDFPVSLDAAGNVTGDPYGIITSVTPVSTRFDVVFDAGLTVAPIITTGKGQRNTTNAAGFDTLTPTSFSIEPATGTTAEKIHFVIHASGVDRKDLTANLIQTVPRIAYIKDIKSTGVNAGNSSSATTVARQLNTIEGDSSFLSLSSSQFTLSAGKYSIDASAPALRPNKHQVLIYNVTDSVAEIIGTSEIISDSLGANMVSRSHVTGEISIITPKTYELRHYIQVGQTDGLGIASSSGNSEVYAMVKIAKLK